MHQMRLLLLAIMAFAGACSDFLAWRAISSLVDPVFPWASVMCLLVVTSICVLPVRVRWIRCVTTINVDFLSRPLFIELVLLPVPVRASLMCTISCV